MSDIKKKNVVTMKNGQEVDFGVRGKLKKATETIGEGAEKVAKIVINCINGDTHEFTFDMNHPLLWEFALHGVSQKITDSITKAEDFEDVSFGVSNQIGRLMKGDWSQRSSDGMVRGFSDVFEAVRRIKEYDLGSAEAGQLKTDLAGKSEEDYKLIKANNGVKHLLAVIASEKAAAKAEKLASESEESVDALGI